MNRILTMALKDIRLMFRDRVGAFFIIGFPILMGLFFGLIMGAPSSGGGGSKMNVAIVDLDQSDVSKSFVESISANDSVNLEAVELEAARESVRKGQRVAMIVLEKGFGETAGVFWEDPPTIKIRTDPSRTAESAMLEGFVMEAMGGLIGSRFQDSSGLKDLLDSSRQDLAEDEGISAANRLLFETFIGSVESMVDSIDALEQKADETSDSPAAATDGFQFANIEAIDVSRTIDPNSIRGQLSKRRSQWDISFPQAMMWGVLACVAGFAISIAKERSQGTLTRLQAAPVSSFEILAGKAMACFIVVIGVIAFMTVLGVMLGMKPGSYPMLVLASLSISACFVGVMMVMSNLGKTEQAVSGSGWAINMIMAMFGGAMMPVMFMPGFMQTVSNFSPIKWGILAVEGAIWRGFSFAEMMLPCGILLTVGAGGLVIGTLMLKRFD